MTASRSTTLDNPRLEAKMRRLRPITKPRTKAEADALFAEVERLYGPDATPTRRGRPAAGERRSPTATHSLRLPNALWDAVVQAARERHMSPTQAAAAALAKWAHAS